MRSAALLTLLMSSMFVVSCVSMPGDLYYSESKAEGTKQLSLDPGWLSGGAMMKMGVYKTSALDKDKAVLEVCLYGDTIGFDESLLINIDGAKTTFKSFDKLSLNDVDVNSRTCFKKRYDVLLSYLQKMISGKSVWVKATTNNGSFVEGEFKEGPTMARNGFVKFMAQINISTGEILNKPAQK